jgi:ribosomal protein L37AE/L43A
MSCVILHVKKKKKKINCKDEGGRNFIKNALALIFTCYSCKETHDIYLFILIVKTKLKEILLKMHLLFTCYSCKETHDIFID